MSDEKNVETHPDTNPEHPTKLDPITDISVDAGASLANVSYPFPPGTFDMTASLRNYLSGLDAKDAALIEKDTSDFIEKIITSTTLYYPDNLYSEVSKGELTNNLTYAGRRIGVGAAAINTKKPTSSKEGVMRLLSIAKQTETVDVDLPHSGFKITLQAPKLLSIVELIKKISGAVIRAGRETNTIAFSNYSAVTNAIIADFILQHLQSTTLDLSKATSEEDAHIFKYISANDYPFIVLGILRSQYPRGVVIKRYCKNALIIDPETKTPKCTFSGHGKVNLDLMAYVDPKYITNDMMLQLSKAGSGVVSIEEVINYQATLEYKSKSSKSFTIDDGTGVVYTIGLGVPNINKLMSAGQRWIDKLVRKAQELFTSDDDTYSKNDKLNAIMNTVIGGTYSSVVTSITTTDESSGETYTVTDENGIDNALNEFSKDTTLTIKILEVCYDFIDNSPIGIVGFPIFSCPTCNERNEGTSNIPEIVPFNVVAYFFALNSLNIDSLEKRD